MLLQGWRGPEGKDRSAEARNHLIARHEIVPGEAGREVNGTNGSMPSYDLDF
jgi:hypothetical protein